jgi:flagellar biosynthesis protein FlhG
MYDQANHLRKLVLAGADDARPPATNAPRLIAVSGGKGGVGATTLAVNLATALARDGRRTLLVDADLEGADVAALCRVEDGYTVADVLSDRRTVHEALQRGPAGVQVLPGAWAPGRLANFSLAAQERLVRQLRGLGGHADFVILDVGSGLSPAVRSFWRSADCVVLATTPELVSVMDAYASIKVHLEGRESCGVYSLVNFTGDSAIAADVHSRLARACQRFLGVSVAAAGHVPDDPHVAVAAAAGRPFFLEFPDCAATRHVDEIAQRLIADPKNGGATLKATFRPRAFQPTSATA